MIVGFFRTELDMKKYDKPEVWVVEFETQAVMVAASLKHEEATGGQLINTQRGEWGDLWK